MNLPRYIYLEVRRLFKEPVSLFFSIFLPVMLFFVFGASQSNTDQPIHDGNVSAYVMISMAVYGGITAAVSTVGGIVVDEMSGWGRQLALTPLRAWQRITAHVAATCVRVSLAVTAVFIAGYVGGASMPLHEWVQSALLTIVAVIPFSLYGLVFGTAFKSSTATSVATTLIVPFSFLGNAFAPLTESLMPLARFSPIYGSVSLARFPLSEGLHAVSTAPYSVTDPLWYAVVNVISWALVFAVAYTLVLRREKGR